METLSPRYPVYPRSALRLSDRGGPCRRRRVHTLPVLMPWVWCVFRGLLCGKSLPGMWLSARIYCIALRRDNLPAFGMGAVWPCFPLPGSFSARGTLSGTPSRHTVSRLFPVGVCRIALWRGFPPGATRSIRPPFGSGVRCLFRVSPAARRTYGLRRNSPVMSSMPPSCPIRYNRWLVAGAVSGPSASTHPPSLM